MKKSSLIIVVALTLLESASGSLPGQATPPTLLPQPVLQELKYLEETYRLLDRVAQKIWPGWDGYRDVPVQFHFQSGLVLLIGHPTPPAGFELLPDLQVSGKKVYVDRRNVSDLELQMPLVSGGGVIPFGEDAQGKPIRIVNMHFSPGGTEKLEDLSHIGERQVLILIHEFFHCFQETGVKIQYGNLMYNPDAAYSYYSSIEGLALEKAYLEKDDAKAKEFLADFLLARKLKRKAAMTDRQAQEESNKDLVEGTAVYAEARTLEVLRTGFQPAGTPGADPFYGGFRDIDFLGASYLERLRQAARDPFETGSKCYPYGCLQALLLQRWSPHWQKPFSEEVRFLDVELAKIVDVSDMTEAQIQERWNALYGAATVQRKCREEIGRRDAAVMSVAKRRGQVYVISFKPIHHFLEPDATAKAYRLGLIEAYPDGLGDIKVNDIEIAGLNTPLEKQQLYFLRIVDPRPKKGQKPYTMIFAKKEGADVFYDVVVQTPLFTLKAPKVQIREEKNRVKLTLLERVHAN